MSERSPLEVFCRQVRARSLEHAAAVDGMAELPGQLAAILRQELDSLVRVIFLLSVHDRTERGRLIAMSIAGKRWTHPNSRRPVMDREMVDLADDLHGWTRSVYSFGCAFIHLSGFHDYLSRDPLALVSDAEREALLAHLRYYHGGPDREHPTFADVIPFLPRAFDKVRGNLEAYVAMLEADKDIDSD